MIPALEPASDLLEPLPADEVLLWRGAPDWRVLALRAFHLRAVALYFTILVLWRAASLLAWGDGVGEVAHSVLWMLALAGVAIGVLAGLAWLAARTTVYWITSRRVVMRLGIALPVTFNIPFRVIEAAALATFGDGFGDIPLKLGGKDRVAFLVLWPHARPWRIARPEPMLRAIPDVARVAGVLAQAISCGGDAEVNPVRVPNASGATLPQLASADA